MKIILPLLALALALLPVPAHAGWSLGTAGSELAAAVSGYLDGVRDGNADQFGERYDGHQGNLGSRWETYRKWYERGYGHGQYHARRDTPINPGSERDAAARQWDRLREERWRETDSDSGTDGKPN